MSGRIVSVTSAGNVMLPRRVTTRTGSPVTKPSEGWTSTHGRGVCSTSVPIRRVWLPDRKCATVRPVVSSIGYSSSSDSVGAPHSTGENLARPSGKKNRPSSNRRGVPG